MVAGATSREVIQRAESSSEELSIRAVGRSLWQNEEAQVQLSMPQMKFVPLSRR